MRIAVLSDCRAATLPVGSHGLGRMGHDIAHHLSQRGQAVTLFAGPGSQFDDDVLEIYADETDRARVLTHRADEFDVWIDLSHHHNLSQFRPSLPVLNWVADGECGYTPPNCIVGNEWQRKQFPTVKIIPLGIEVDAIDFYGAISNGGYLMYAAKIEWRKGYDVALEVAQITGKRLIMAGENLEGAHLPSTVEYVGQITDNNLFHSLLGCAECLLAPSRYDAGGRGVLEAQATGTPVLCLDGTGTKHHVKHGVSGYWCRNANEMAEVVGAVGRMGWCVESGGDGRR
jgi:glycosyltransferase involved in cell wall biosynthesis